MLQKFGKLDAKPYLYKPSSSRATGIALSDADINDGVVGQGFPSAPQSLQPPLSANRSLKYVAAMRPLTLALWQRRAARLFQGGTAGWKKLKRSDGGRAMELIITVEQHFLSRYDSFRAIEEILKNGHTKIICRCGRASRQLDIGI